MARTLATADLNEFGNRQLATFRRYDRSLQNDLNTAFEQAQHESPHAATNARFLRSVPAHFFDSPAPVGSPEPRLDGPNEPKATAAFEPETPPTLTTNDEPQIIAPPAPRIDPPIMPNEPKIVAPDLPNEPKPAAPRKPAAAFPGAFQPPPGMNPELLALLEADLPDPNTLDPAWCRQYIAANLGIDPARLGPPPAPPAPFPPRDR